MVRGSPLAFPLRKAWVNRPPGKPSQPRLSKRVRRGHGTKVHWRPLLANVLCPAIPVGQIGFWLTIVAKMPVEASTSESVYVLDDDPSILKAIDRLLATEGIMVRGFSDPADFLAFVQTHSVPVAILDVWMDRMTGLE